MVGLQYSPKTIYSPPVVEMCEISGLAALAAAVALDSSPCIVNNTKLAKKIGATKAEIMETIAVAKFAKSATVLSSSAQALARISHIN